MTIKPPCFTGAYRYIHTGVRGLDALHRPAEDDSKRAPFSQEFFRSTDGQV